MEHLFDTHFHLDLQKDRVSAIRTIEEKQIYTIAVTNLPDLYRKESVEIASNGSRSVSIQNWFINTRNKYP